eukprot:Skav231551  [mRNA]  locus=scaffold481:9947:10840:- [translate_table: standard]
MKKALSLCLLVLVASESCYEADEVQLLQARNDDNQAQIPGLDKLMDSVSDTIGAAKELANHGIASVTGQLTDALDKVDSEILSATQKFNSSVQAFLAGANVTNSIATNFTKLQKLVSKTVEDVMPCYSATLNNLKGAVTASKGALEAMGQDELLEKLESCQGTAIEKFTQLADSTEEMGRNFANMASTKINEALPFMHSKTQQAVDITKDLRVQFDEKTEAFAATLEPKLALMLGDESVQLIDHLKKRTDKSFKKLVRFVSLVNTELSRCGDTVGVQLEKASQQKGFWSRIFGGIFG